MLTNHEDNLPVALNRCRIISKTHSQVKLDDKNNDMDAAQVLVVRAKKAPRLDPATLACHWGIGLAAAAKTI
jgi:hypothetical protein